MKTINTRFGEVEYDPKEILHFPKGLVGFEELRDFIVMPNKKEGPLFWIQSTDDPDIAFILTDPTNFFLDYTIQPGAEEKEELKIKDDADCFVLSVVTVTPAKEITLNLAAPILFSSKNNLALQVILEDSPYQTKTPLPDIK
jgi:flagellar assembly factor FliW